MNIWPRPTLRTVNRGLLSWLLLPDDIKDGKTWIRFRTTLYIYLLFYLYNGTWAINNGCDIFSSFVHFLHLSETRRVCIKVISPCDNAPGRTSFASNWRIRNAPVWHGNISNYMMSRCRINDDSTSWNCINFYPMLHKRHRLVRW